MEIAPEDLLSCFSSKNDANNINTPLATTNKVTFPLAGSYFLVLP